VIAGTTVWPKVNGGSCVVTIQPWASSGSALTNCTVTRAPLAMTMAGFVIPAMPKVMSGPKDGTATTVKAAEEPLNVIVRVDRSMLAPAGTCSLSAFARAMLTVCGARPASLVPACLAMRFASAAEENPALAPAPPGTGFAELPMLPMLPMAPELAEGLGLPAGYEPPYFPA
jgi:hypothetical protein